MIAEAIAATEREVAPEGLGATPKEQGRPTGPAPLLTRTRGRKSLARRAVDDVMYEFLAALMSELESSYATRRQEVRVAHRCLTDLHNLIEEERSDLELFPLARFCRARILLAITRQQGRATRSRAVLTEFQTLLADFQRRRREIERSANAEDLNRFYEKNYWHLRAAHPQVSPIESLSETGFSAYARGSREDIASSIDSITIDIQNELKRLRRRDCDSGRLCLEFFFRYVETPVAYIITHTDAIVYGEAHRLTPRELETTLRELVEILQATESLERLHWSTLGSRLSLIAKVKPVTWKTLQKVSACHRENPQYSFIAADNALEVIGDMLRNQQHFINTFNERRELVLTGADEFTIPPSTSWRRGYRHWEEPKTAQQVLFDLRRMIESHAAKKHYTIKSDADGGPIAGQAFMTIASGPALIELGQELKRMGLFPRRRIVRDRRGSNSHGTHEYYADIHWGGSHRAHETGFYVRVYLGKSRAYTPSGIEKFVKEQARAVGLGDVSNWEIVDYLQRLAGTTPRAVSRMIYRYREPRGFRRGMTIDRLLGEDTCSHSRGSWRPTGDSIKDLPGRVFSCPDCRRDRIAFVPAHQLPSGDEVNAMIGDEERYIARWREFQHLRGEKPAAANSLGELRRQEPALDLRRGRFSIQRGEIVPLIEERPQLTPAKTLSGVLRRRPAPVLASA